MNIYIRNFCILFSYNAILREDERKSNNEKASKTYWKSYRRFKALVLTYGVDRTEGNFLKVSYKSDT